MDRINVLDALRLDDGDDLRAPLFGQDLFWIGFDIPWSDAIWLIAALLVSLGLWGGIGFAVASFVSWVAG